MCERAFVVVCSVRISALVKLFSPRCHSLCKRLIWPDSSIFFPTVYDIIYPSDVLMIILFSLPAKGPPSPVSKHSSTLSIDFPQETVARSVSRQVPSVQQTSLRLHALFTDASMLSHMPHSISSMPTEDRFHFSDLTRRAPQNKQGVKDSWTRSKLLPF